MGDVLRPQRQDREAWCIISQVVNNVGAFKAGLAAQTASRFPNVKKHFYDWTRSSTYHLGSVEFCIMESEQLVFALLCCQDGLPGKDNPEPLKYPMMGACIDKLGRTAADMQAEIHMPKMGCGLARGDWNLVSPFLLKLIPESVPVFVYERPRNYSMGMRTYRTANRSL